MYALMQARGLVNDHLEGCAARMRAMDARSSFRSAYLMFDANE